MCDILIITGPTASGKSQLAMLLAQKFDGVIVNADAMQLYQEIPIITSSPTIEDKNYITHYLYNYVPICGQPHSVAAYLEDVLPVIKRNVEKLKLAIIVGGTGMYIDALINGISYVPKIHSQIKNDVQNIYNILGKEKFYQKLIQLDPSSHYINSHDMQRMMRSYEVMLQTGKSLTYFHDFKTVSPIQNYKFKKIVLLPERKLLYDNCNQRFIKMLNQGGLEEVKKISPYHDKINISARKALGISQLMLYLNGELSLNEAVSQAQIKTRQYAKRQLTWLRNKSVYVSESIGYNYDANKSLLRFAKDFTLA